MEKRLNFETFLVNYGDQFHNYLSEKSCDWEKGSRYRELQDKIDELFRGSYAVRNIIQNGRPTYLTEADSKILIEVLAEYNTLTTLEWEKIYMQGCADCLTYLKMIEKF